ncbi:MAG TPA: SpoIIE family protein phosphatase [Blastococcus sp.]
MAVGDVHEPPSADGPGRDRSEGSGLEGDGPLGDLRAQLEHYATLVELAPDAIVVLDAAAGSFVDVNPAAQRLFGLTREQLLAVGPVELSPPEQPDGRSSAEAAAQYIARALAGEQPSFEWTHRRSDGSMVPCEMTLLRLPPAGSQRVRASILDVTDRREAVSARRTAEEAQAARSAAEAGAARLQAMVAGLNAIVWEYDAASRRIRYINDRAEQLLGYPVSRWLDDETLWTSIIEPADRERVLQTVTEGIAVGGDFALDYRVRASDGRRVWLQQLGHVAPGDGAATTVHSVLIDITEQKRRAQTSALLAAAGRALTAPGTVEQRLTAVTQLLIGDLCDWAAVWLRGEDDRYRPVAAAPAELAAQVLALPPWQAPRELQPRLYGTRAFAVPHVTEQMLRDAATDEAHHAALAQLGGTAWLVAPLTAGDAVVGVLTLTAGPGTRFDDADVSFAADLGQRLATMVAAERLAAQRRQLHDLTVRLAAAGTVAEAAAAVSTGLRTVLGASVVSVCTMGDDGLLHTVDVAGYLPERLTEFTAMRLTAALPLTDAARTRRPVWLDDRATIVARYPLVAPVLLEATQSLASLPLLAGDRLVGALGVTFTRPRPFDSDEQAFLLTVAGQVAVAFERAALADARRDMADTLQRSLLPGDLPALSGVAVTARYLPAVEGTRAGGDWYDVLAVDGGRVALAVGDVVGHGAPAAAVMGQLRSALAALLLAGCTPARALENLDRFAGHVPGARVSTVACLLLDPGTGRVMYSNAGHPFPLLLTADGHAQLDGGLGPALGVAAAGRRRPEATTTVPGGGTLLLYTDGLVEERRESPDDAVERLLAAAGVRRVTPLPALVDGLLSELAGPAGFGDDVAMVALRLLPTPFRLGVHADPAQLSAVRRSVGQWATTAGLDPDSIEDLQLALGEATGNAVEHAYREAPTPGRVLVEIDLDDDGALAVRVTDTGAWRPVPTDPGHRGRGLRIISALSEDVHLDPSPSGTTVRFRFVPAARDATPAATATAAEDSSRPEDEPATVGVFQLDGRRHLAVGGDLDLAGVLSIRDLLDAELDRPDRPPLTVDLTGVSWLASAGIGLLLAVAERAGQQTDFVLPPSGPARRVLDLTGVTEALRPQRRRGNE